MSPKPTNEEKSKALDKVEKTKGSDSSVDEKKLSEKLQNEYRQDWDSLEDIRATWDDKEAILVSKSLDSSSQTTKSQVNDPRLATIILERAARVMAQLQTGSVQALTMDDTGKNMFMKLVHEKYIQPNANAQWDLLTKYRMWDIYSNTYGTMPMLVDYRIDDNYVGPDCYLVPMRNFVPQAGRVSIQDCDHVFIDTPVSVGWLKKRSPKYWKNLDEIITKASQGGKDPTSKDSQKRSFIERNRYSRVGGGKGDSATVWLSTRYMADRWVTMAPDFDCTVVRDINNPQKNNRISVVLKHCFPLLDSIIGLGEMERGKTLQYAVNSLINLYLDGVKMSIFPPIMIQADGVVPSSIRINPAAKWLLTKPNCDCTLPGFASGHADVSVHLLLLNRGPSQPGRHHRHHNDQQDRSGDGQDTRCAQAAVPTGVLT
jgi:hypothetical protein